MLEEIGGWIGLIPNRLARDILKMTLISELIQLQRKPSGRASLRLAEAVIVMTVILVSTFSALPSVAGQTITGSLTFQRGENNAFTGLIDTVHGFAYFATDTQPGQVIKIRLSDFTKVGSLLLNPHEDFLSSGVIDVANGFAYFGTYNLGSPLASIIKVRLSDLTRVGAITPSRTQGRFFTTAVIDTTNGFAYFGDYRDGIVDKVRLSDFTLASTLRLPNGSGLFGSALDSSFAYFSTNFYPGYIFKIRLSNFTLAQSITIGVPLGSTPLIDPTNGLSYWPTDTDPGSILRIRVSDLAITGNITLNPGEASPNSAVIDTAEGFAYFGTAGTQGLSSEIVKININISDFHRTSTLMLASYESLLFLSAAGVIQTNTDGGTFAYFATYTSPTFILKIKLSNMQRAGTITLQQGEQDFDNSVIDTGAGFVYFGSDSLFGTGSAIGAISRIRTSDFTNAGTLLLNPGEGPICSSVIDTANGFAYFGTDSMPAKIIKVRLSDFSRVSALTLNTGEDFACTGVIDTVNGFAYFAAQNIFAPPANVVKIRLSDFTIVGTGALGATEGYPISSAIDIQNGFAYFGTLDFPGLIDKVRLSDLTEVGSLTIDQDQAAAAAIDPSGGFAYFGTFEGVVKIRLSDFSENMSVTLSCCQSGIFSGVLDLSHGFGYFGGHGFVAKIQLSDLTEVGSTTTADPNETLFSASIDPAAGIAYFGVASDPAKVYRVSL